MRIVHNGSYISLPLPGYGFVKYAHPQHMTRLLVYLVDEPTFIRYATPRDYYVLFEEMIYHDIVHPHMLQYVSNCVMPDVTSYLSGHILLRCLDRGITFRTSTKSILSYNTIDTLDVSDRGIKLDLPFLRHLHRFTNLRSLTIRNITTTGFSLKITTFDTIEELDVSGSNVTHDIIANLTQLRKLKTTKSSIRLTMFDSQHPIYRSVEELEVDGSEIDSLTLSRFVNLRSLTIVDKMPINMSFITPSHPWCETLQELYIEHLWYSDEVLQHLRNLRKLNMRNNERVTLSFVDEHHPWTTTMRELNIAYTNVKYESIKHMKCLTMLNIAGTDITFDKDAQFAGTLLELNASMTAQKRGIRFMKKLQILTLNDCDNVSLDYFDESHPLCDTIQELYIDRSPIPMKNLQHLKNLRKLTLSSVPWSSLDFLVEDHPIASSLEEFTFDTNFDVKFLLAFRNLRRIRSFMGKGFFSGMDSSHPLCDSLESLEVIYNSIDDNSLVHLRKLRRLHCNVTGIQLKFPPNHPIFDTLNEISIDRKMDSLCHFRRLRKIIMVNSTAKIDNPIPLRHTLQEIVHRHSGLTDASLSEMQCLQRFKQFDPKKLKVNFLDEQHSLFWSLRQLE